jgi:uncharacterized protein YraI
MPRPGNCKRRLWVAGTLVVILVATACAATTDVRDAESEQATPTTGPTSPTTLVVSTVTPIVATVTSSTTTSTTMGPVTTVSVPSTIATMPIRPVGVPYDGPGPRVGDHVGVVGVAFDDSLNVRTGPGIGYEIVATLPPMATDIGVTGRTRLFPSSLWYEIDAGGLIGWVNTSYIALLGATDDATSEIVAIHGSIPSADTMPALGAIVTSYYAREESGSTVNVTAAPSVGSLGEITYDVVGLADDAILGYRLHVFGQQDEGAGPFSLYSVERTSLCWRGVTDDGLCV